MILRDRRIGSLKPKVVFVASSLRRGLNFHFTNLAIALHKRLGKLIVVSGPKEQEDGLFSKLNSEGIRTFADPCVDEPSLGNLVRGISFFGQLTDQEEINLFHVQSMYCLLMVFLSSKVFFRKGKTRILCTIHGFLQGRRYQKIGLFIGSMILNLCADLVITVAEDTSRKFLRCGLLKAKAKFVHNGMDLKLFDEITSETPFCAADSYQKADASVLVSCCASLIPRKGHKYLILALAEVIRRSPTIRIESVLTGEGSLKEKLIVLAREFGISEHIHFTGRVSYEELYRLLVMTDIYVFPSLSESCPFAILEAMAAGRPIVSTNVGGIPEMIEDCQTGLLVPPADAKQLADAITRLLENPAKAKEMGKRCRILVEEEFDINQIANDLVGHYESSFVDE